MGSSNFMLSLVEHEKGFITSRSVHSYLRVTLGIGISAYLSHMMLNLFSNLFHISEKGQDITLNKAVVGPINI